LQFTKPPPHVAKQAPPPQTSPAAHACPQPPQWFGSLEVSAHALPHRLKPALHVKPHWPLWQVGAPFGGALQELPQSPQLARLFETLTHCEPHFVNPA
jgi:hypothetical protein